MKQHNKVVRVLNIIMMTPVIIMFIAEKKQAAKLPSVSDDYENEVGFLSKQLEDLSVHQSSVQSYSSMAQNGNHFAAGTISDVSNDESLQDIIDSILPSDSNNHSSNPPAKMNDAGRKFSAAATGSPRSDTDDDYVFSDDDDYDDEEEGGGVDDDNDDDHDNYDIPEDFKPLQTKVLGCSLHHDNEREINEKSQTSAPSSVKGVEAIPDLKLLLECIDTDDYYNYDSCSMNTHNGKPIELPLTSCERKTLGAFNPIPSTGIQRVVESRDNSKGHRNNPTSTKRENEKSAKAKLSDADLIEIFGSSDEEGDDKSFVMKQSSCSAKLEGGTKTCDTGLSGTIVRKNLHGDVFDSSEMDKFLHKLQHAKLGFPCDTDSTSVLAENGKEFITNSKGCLASNLQDDSCAKSNTIRSFKGDANLGAKGKKEELAKATRKVLEPANTVLNNTFHPSMQAFDSHKKENSDSVDEISSHESSGKFQEYESWKENAASPFDDYMPAPLSKRLGKQFSAKQRLASLHSISSVTDDS